MYRVLNPSALNNKVIAGFIGLLLAFFIAALPNSAHAATFTVINTNPSGAGSFVQALADAQAAPDLDTIAFNIPGTGPHTIRYVRDSGGTIIGTPAITNPVIVDGCTQHGSDCSGAMPQLMIELDGGYYGSQQVALSATQASPFYFDGSAISGSAVRGLMINRVAARACLFGCTPQLANAIRLPTNTTASNITIEFNIIGTDNNGTPGIGNTGYGISIGGVDNAVIRNNIVVANGAFGLDMGGHYSPPPQQWPDNTIITGNYIGVLPNGTPLGNQAGGIRMFCTENTRIGGLAAGEANTIANNGTQGIMMYHRNTAGGINCTLPPSDRNTTVIGNTIRNNTGAGVALADQDTGSPTTVSIRQNSIYANGGLGIDLGNNGVTANAPAGQTRVGPNNYVNFPVITSIEHGSTIVKGTYAGAANQAYTLDFYSNDTADPSGNGQGQTWIGAGNVTTDASGNAAFSFTFTTNAVPGAFISGTATDALGNTSEFSGIQLVPPLPAVPVVPGAPSTGIASSLSPAVLAIGALLPVIVLGVLYRVFLKTK